MGNTQSQIDELEVKNNNLSSELDRMKGTHRAQEEKFKSFQQDYNNQKEKNTELALQNSKLLKKTNTLTIDLNDVTDAKADLERTLHEQYQNQLEEQKKEIENLQQEKTQMKENLVILQDEYKVLNTEIVTSRNSISELEEKLERVPIVYKMKMKHLLEKHEEEFIDDKVNVFENDTFKEQCLQEAMNESIIPNILEETYCSDFYRIIISNVIAELKKIN